MSNQLNNLRVLKPIRQALRNDATEAESALWQCLRRSQLDGRKFRRQHSIGYFVLDFYCPSERLVIELDGGIHDDPEVRDNDELRQQAIESLEIRVLRFRNEEVFFELKRVLATIRTAFTC
ncbi:MAG: endonuclease domain-containing protein [Cytophagales bacterium]|nr:MAG: endonuclease domain-containing protein [Cytophagales bacterium]